MSRLLKYDNNPFNVKILITEVDRLDITFRSEPQLETEEGRGLLEGGERRGGVPWSPWRCSWRTIVFVFFCPSDAQFVFRFERNLLRRNSGSMLKALTERIVF